MKVLKPAPPCPRCGGSFIAEECLSCGYTTKPLERMEYAGGGLAANLLIPLCPCPVAHGRPGLSCETWVQVYTSPRLPKPKLGRPPKPKPRKWRAPLPLRETYAPLPDYRPSYSSYVWSPRSTGTGFQHRAATPK